MSFVTKIAVLFIGFVGLIVTLVVKSYGTNAELVADDYYAQELKYQDKLDAMNNEKALLKSISHTVNEQSIVLSIDSALMSDDFVGEIVFFRPSDSSKDVRMKMEFKNNEQVINTSKLVRGEYKMQLSWSVRSKSYYQENVVFIK